MPPLGASVTCLSRFPAAAACACLAIAACAAIAACTRLAMSLDVGPTAAEGAVGSEGAPATLTTPIAVSACNAKFPGAAEAVAGCTPPPGTVPPRASNIS